MSKIIYYTAIFGDTKDQLRELPNFPNAEFHAYVDTVSGDLPDRTGWLLRTPRFQEENPRRKARKHKVLAHELYPNLGPDDFTIWLDGTMTPAIEPVKLVRRYLQSDIVPSGRILSLTPSQRIVEQKPRWDIATFRHSERCCVYQEAEAVCRGKKDDVATVRKQMRSYHDQGYPYHNGLAETMVVIRRHTEAVTHFNNVWWTEIVQGSLRDQLSFDKAAWDVGIDYRRFDDSYRAQKDFDFRGHW